MSGKNENPATNRPVAQLRRFQSSTSIESPFNSCNLLDFPGAITVTEGVQCHAPLNTGVPSPLTLTPLPSIRRQKLTSPCQECVNGRSLLLPTPFSSPQGRAGCCPGVWGICPLHVKLHGVKLCVRVRAEPDSVQRLPPWTAAGPSPSGPPAATAPAACPRCRAVAHLDIGWIQARSV